MGCELVAFGTQAAAVVGAGRQLALAADAWGDFLRGTAGAEESVKLLVQVGHDRPLRIGQVFAHTQPRSTPHMWYRLRASLGAAILPDSIVAASFVMS